MVDRDSAAQGLVVEASISKLAGVFDAAVGVDAAADSAAVVVAASVAVAVAYAVDAAAEHVEQPDDAHAPRLQKPEPEQGCAWPQAEV